MYSEELAQEQQLTELRGAGPAAAPPLLAAPQPTLALGQPVSPAQHAGSGRQQPLLPQPDDRPPRLGSSLSSAVDAGLLAPAAPSADSAWPSGFGRSLAPLLPPRRGSGRPVPAAVAPVPAMPAFPAPQLPPVHTSAEPQPPAVRPAPSAPPPADLPPAGSSATSRSRPRLPPASPAPNSVASSSQWLDVFDGTETPPLPAGEASDPAAESAAGGVVVTHNPLNADEPGDSATQSPPPSVTRSEVAEQLPDLIQLQSPEPLPPLQLPAAASDQTLDLRTASWPLPAAGGGGMQHASCDWRHRAGSADGAGHVHLVGASSDAAATAGPLGQGAAALQPLETSLRAQLRRQQEEQQAWWQQQQQKRQRQQREPPPQQTQPQPQTVWPPPAQPEAPPQPVPAALGPAPDQQPPGSHQAQPTQQPWLPVDSENQRAPSAVASQLQAQPEGPWDCHPGSDLDQQPWWQQLQRGQGQERPWKQPQDRSPWPDNTTQPDSRRQQAAQQPAAQQLAALQVEAQQQPAQQQPAQQLEAAADANNSGPPSRGALWSSFFEFPDEDLTDCHPALLQVSFLPALFCAKLEEAYCSL